MRTRIFRTLSTMFSLLLLVAVPTQASPIKFVDVVNVMGDLQNGGQIQRLKLRAALQDQNAKTTSGPSTSTTTPATSADPLVASNLAAPGTDTAATSLTSGTAVLPQQPQGDVQVFDQDSVDGTICDCGEIPAVGGGIPWWPFLALIPLVCLTGVCTSNGKVPPPKDTPPEEPIPEPTSLLLFGSGIVALTASARRRYAKMRASKEAATMTEV